MEHKIKVQLTNAEGKVVQNSERNGMVQYLTRTVRERVLTRLFGKPHRITVIVPSDHIKGITIEEVSDGKGRN